jgi:hypothetical protein
MGALARTDHDELSGLGFSSDLFCTEAEQAVFSPYFFVDDEGFLFFVHFPGFLATTKIAEYRNNFNISATGAKFLIFVIDEAFEDG